MSLKNISRAQFLRQRIETVIVAVVHPSLSSSNSSIMPPLPADVSPHLPKRVLLHLHPNPLPHLKPWICLILMPLQLSHKLLQLLACLLLTLVSMLSEASKLVVTLILTSTNSINLTIIIIMVDSIMGMAHISNNNLMLLRLIHFLHPQQPLINNPNSNRYSYFPCKCAMLYHHI